MFIKNSALVLAFMALAKIATAGHPPPCLASVIASLSDVPPAVASVANACGPNAASASSAIQSQCGGQATAALRYFANVVCPQAGHPGTVSVPSGTNTGTPPSGPGATGGAPAGPGPTGGAVAGAPPAGGAPPASPPSGGAPAGAPPAGAPPAGAPAGGAHPASPPSGAAPAGAPAGGVPPVAPAAGAPAGGAPPGSSPPSVVIPPSSASSIQSASASSIHSAAPSLFTAGAVPDRQLSANMVAAAVFLGAAAAL
ncbi:hypothetical protein N7474_008600 [Penicillium riverlandense]|uniref:uncharacterized protein n=1 Tax=Penicillium riverlandense TaxID=1903569 RepID=UPI0025482FF6|nr:uncharacterized protein N7474_008600 [Penicillium riverlandense]KAJ5812299.1 hypothetical protein N7474_008600 [Penicillium riverlandense]